MKITIDTTKFTNKEKKILKIVGMIAIIMLIATPLFLINMKPIITKKIMDYNEKAVLFEYTNKSYEGIEIPEDVKVVFVENIISLNSNILDLLLDSINYNTMGTYDQRKKEITLLYDVEVEKKKEYLIHEIAHYEWHNTLTIDEKKTIKDKHKLFCQNPSEFHAYITGEYGEFNYE